MTPIFNDYIKFLKDKGINISDFNLCENMYWLDSQIIKAYDKQGNIHKILRLSIDDDLNLSIKTIYKDKPFEIESWLETIERERDKLELLEIESLNLISRKTLEYKSHIPIILSSGGKDSIVTTYLTHLVNPDTEVIFSNTSLDCADTYKYIKQQPNTRIINPKEGFYQWRERLQFIGNRMSRACCTKFKEGSMMEVLDKSENYLFFMGMRNEESNARSNYTDEWKNDKWGERNWEGVLPIRKWAEEDIWLYILWKDLDINTKYLKGYHRVGCAISCAFYTKSTWVLDKYWYPTMYNRWQKILDNDFTDNHKALIMNCTKSEYKLKAWNGGVFRTTPTIEVIKEFADENELDIIIAEKYFSHICEDCCKRIKSKEVLAMNMKYFGRNINKFFCKKCLMKNLNLTKEQWKEKVEDFKSQGCNLF